MTASPSTREIPHVRPKDVTSASVDQAVERALERVAPLFPLARFVAVNPFVGLTSAPLTATAARVGAVHGASVFMPRPYYREAFARGEIEERDVRTAMASMASRGETIPPLGSVMEALITGERRMAPTAVTFADLLDRSGNERFRAVPAVVERISRFAAAYFDEGQALWSLPRRDRSLWSAWRRWAQVDRSPDVWGLRGVRETFASLHEEPMSVIRRATLRLGLSSTALDVYLARCITSIEGWIGFARHRAWGDDAPVEARTNAQHLLAIRVAWDLALYESHDESIRGAWSVVARAMSTIDVYTPDRDTRIDLVLLEAAEAALRRRYFHRLTSARASTVLERPAIQAVFCIDVRSERMRRALESVREDVQTVGFAGFFGLAMSYAEGGGAAASPHCPVLLAPRHHVAEHTSQAADHDRRRRRAEKGWLASFKSAAVGGLAFVETAAPLAFLDLLSDALGRPASRDESGAPNVAALPLADRVAVATAFLRGTSLRDGLSPLVVIVAHGSRTANNAHAAGLACGACGGHGGAPNARGVAAILNDPEVRRELMASGLEVPEDTYFVAANHDTVTDEVTVYDDGAPLSHRGAIAGFVEAIAAAAVSVRCERASTLGLRDGSPAPFVRRGRDWSEVRPEWGLAGNALFVAAPRDRTRGTSFDGRAFLHDYDAAADPDGAVLELILTAPVVVASWINLQYYAATVAPDVFGAGNKVLHNVVSGVGVLEGNGGDLRMGLPLQSVHDGVRFVHEPVRLHVVVEATEKSIERVLAKHPEVRDLFVNGWVHLFAIDDGRIARFVGSGWSAL